jgi:hypothetical protein
MLRSKLSILAAAATGLLVFGQPAFAAEGNGLAIAAQATTKAEHEAAATAHEKEGAAVREKAANHKRDAKTYLAGGNPKLAAGQIAKHCDKLSQQYTDVVAEHEAIAKLHRELAAQAK